MFCRIDVSGNPVDLGEAIEGNRFYDCESYENNAAGFSFNISSTSGEGGSITNNYIEAVYYNNVSSGVRFRNKMPNSIVENNEINLVCYGNRGLSKNGNPSSVAGGLGNDANSTYRVTGITGTMVSYGNIGADVNVVKAYNCSITVYHPLSENLPVLKKGDASNSITVIDFSCSDSIDEWCVQKYCNGIINTTVNDYSNKQNSSSLSQIYPNPFHRTTNIEYTIPAESFVSLKIYDVSGRELTTLVNEKQQGHYKIEFDRRNLTNGIYFYRIHAGSFIETKKFVLK